MAVAVVVKPIKRIFYIGAIAVTMLFAPEVANAEVYSSALATPVFDVEGSASILAEEGDAQCSELLNRAIKKMGALKHLDNTFESQFKASDTDREVFRVAYDKLADVVANWGVLDSFVDVSRSRRVIDFNLVLAHDIFVSVATLLDDDKEDVMFSIARNGRTLVIDKLPLAMLNDKILGMMDELDTNFDSKV